ncbi:MAG: hypothetical protein HOV81_20850 [Kofleriaceae bacterium]|nr:hypothetical protein [Kofleriaceae bacterium]
MPRELRGLVPFEVAAVLAAAFVPLPIPNVVPLLVLATISLYVRRTSWAERMRGPALYAAIGAIAGLVALVLAIFLGTPLVETLSDQAVNWSMYPVVRGSGVTAVTFAIVVGVGALASELVLRGWIVERVLELGRGSAVVAVMVGGFAEALLAGGPLEERLGAGVFGLGLGAMYIAAGRSVVAPICARLVFSLGAVVLEALRLVG